MIQTKTTALKNLQLSRKDENNTVIKYDIFKQILCFFSKRYNHHFYIQKDGNTLDSYFTIKTLQLFIKSIAYCGIQRLQGISDVNIIR